jgi:hypothetical protein
MRSFRAHQLRSDAARETSLSRSMFGAGFDGSGGWLDQCDDQCERTSRGRRLTELGIVEVSKIEAPQSVVTSEQQSGRYFRLQTETDHNRLTSVETEPE